MLKYFNTKKRTDTAVLFFVDLLKMKKILIQTLPLILLLLFTSDLDAQWRKKKKKIEPNNDILELNVEPPVYREGDIKNGFGPVHPMEPGAKIRWGPEGDNEPRDFYEFLAGTKYAIVVFNEHWFEIFLEENKYPKNPSGASLRLQMEATEMYLKNIGFEEVGFVFGDAYNIQIDDSAMAVNASIIRQAKSLCDIAYFSWNPHNLRMTEDDIFYSGGLGIFESCNYEQYLLYTQSMNGMVNQSFFQEILYKQFSTGFWHKVNKNSKYRVGLKDVEKPGDDERFKEIKRTILPRTKWRENNLKEYFDSNNTDSIEGIYEQLHKENKDVKHGKYLFGVIKSDEGYDIIYLDGARNSDDWKEGDLQAKMLQTSTRIYKLDMYLPDKRLDSNWYAFIDEVSLLTFRYGSLTEDDKDEKYLKLYPTENFSGSNTSPAIEEYVNSGTGFAISSDGLIVTNQHVIESANEIIVQSSTLGKSSQYNAKVVLEDEKNDLAILQIDDTNFSSLSKIPYVLKNDISEMGTKVYTLGYPLIDTMGESIKLTDGLISSKRGFQGDISSYQISVPVQPGNSGGPLFDDEGNLIGIVNSKHLNAENVSYAIKSNYLKNLIDLLPNPPSLNRYNNLENSSLPDQVGKIQNFIFLIKTK